MPAATARAPCAARPYPKPGPHVGVSSKSKRYNPRHPERTLLYKTIAEPFETWHALASAGQFDGQGGVCIQAHDRAALERLLRYCARPPFAMERLRKEGAALVYRCAKQRSEPGSDKRGAKAGELRLTPLELIERIAALVPPPRTHRHRYFGVLAPSPATWCWPPCTPTTPPVPSPA